jgi:hypothetical protein
LPVSFMINPALRQSPKHLTLLAHMVLGYTELEIRFAAIAGIALGLRYEVLNAAEKMYSEMTKIKVIDALCKRSFKSIGLGKEYNITRKMLYYCAGLRNSYAHSQWVRNGRSRHLDFFDGSEMFDGDVFDYGALKKKRLPLKLLREQAAYFEETRKWLLWLELTLGQRSEPNPYPWPRPQEMPPPPTHYSPPSRKPAPKKTTRPATPVKRRKSQRQ